VGARPQGLTLASGVRKHCWWRCSGRSLPAQSRPHLVGDQLLGHGSVADHRRRIKPVGGRSSGFVAKEQQLERGGERLPLLFAERFKEDLVGGDQLVKRLPGDLAALRGDTDE
jgi:hypothetical protein